ncbi:MAG: alpha-L-fucosidase [Pirellulales bacterium]|nr:alpha-L-fucosidase [Pirellulales bacterium]
MTIHTLRNFDQNNVKARFSLPRVFLMSALAVLPTVSLADEPRLEPATERTRVLADWEKLKYGMFIHFGMSTFTGDEYGKTPAASEVFNPTNLDADQWIRTAKAAGMKYAVLTTKHCYGHALWPTKASDYGVATSSVKVDVVRRFVDACRKHGIKPGFYYLLGWETMHQAKMSPPEYEEFCRKQLTELLTQYGPILEIWLDIPWDMGVETERVLADLYALVKKLQPDCLVALNQGRYYPNGKVATRVRTYRHQPIDGIKVDLWPRDMDNVEISVPPAGGHVCEQEFRGKRYYIPLEICETVMRHWFDLEGDAVNTLPTLYHKHRACTAGNANFLLNVGPDKSGRIPADVVDRLMELRRAIDDPAIVPVNLLADKKATASNVLGDQSKHVAGNLTDNDSRTIWATDANKKSAWIEFDLGGKTTFDGAVATEAGKRIEKFAIEIPDGRGRWKAVYESGKMGRSGQPLRFAPVTADKVRLHILQSSGGPAIWDFEIYDGGKN